MKLETKAALHLYKHVESCYTVLSDSEHTEVIMYYSGDVGNGISNAITAKLEDILDERIESRQAVKRFFYVFIEAIQNIRIHGVNDQKNHVAAGIVVYLQDKNLCAVMLNIATAEQAEIISERYDAVNKVGSDELKKLYLSVLQNGEISEKGGAGLGIITMAMRSKSQLRYEVIPSEDGFVLFQSSFCVSL